VLLVRIGDERKRYPIPWSPAIRPRGRVGCATASVCGRSQRTAGWSISTSRMRPAARVSERPSFEAAISRATARGCGRIELDVNEQNEPARALYRAAGFTEEPKPPGRT